MSGDYQNSTKFLNLLEQWGGVTLVIEDASSMLFFKESFLELKKWLEDAGVALSVYSLSASENSEVQLNKLPDSGNSLLGEACNELPPPNDGNPSLILLYTDFVSPHWKNGRYNEILDQWANDGHFLTLITDIPDWTWGRTSLGACEKVHLETEGPPSHRLSSWKVSPKDLEYLGEEGVPNQSDHTIIPMRMNLNAEGLDHLSWVLGDDSNTKKNIFSICLPGPEQKRVLSEEIRDEEQAEPQNPSQQDSRKLDPRSVTRFCHVGSPKASALLEELLIDNQGPISYDAIQKMQKELFGEIDPMITFETISASFWIERVLLPNGEKAEWGKTVNLDTC
jgi:hypothetical protein